MFQKRTLHRLAAGTVRGAWQAGCLAACIAACLIGISERAAAQDAGQWLTGPALARRLSEPADVQWKTGAVLRDSLGRLSKALHVAIVLDRRVDPSRELEVDCLNMPLREVLQTIVREFNRRHAQATSFPRPAPEIELKEFPAAVYLGPKSVADNLRTLVEMRREEVRKLPPAQAERFNARAERWDELATPRQIVADLGKQSGVAILGVDELVPHDHWPRGEWPTMSLVERLTLLAAQFDLTFHVEAGGKQVRLVRISPDDVKIERTHTVASGAAKVAEAWRAACPDAEIRQTGNRITVRGRLEDHEWLAGSAKAKTPATAVKGKTVYTYTVKNKELGVVIRHLAEQLKLKLTMDEEAIAAAGIDLKDVVSLTVEMATVEELLTKALPKGLKFRIQGGTLEITPQRSR
jgi:hypothetical protein